MKTVGFPISRKENENRRALLPSDIEKISYPNKIFIENGYGEVMGFSDDDYRTLGVQIADRTEVLKKDIICDPKIGDAEYLEKLENQTIFGWIHAVQNKKITDVITKNKLTAYAWEDMFEKGRHVFYRNNEIAGEAAIVHAYMLHGLFPYESKVAILGRGNIARGALKILNYMGADVTVYDRKTEKLFQEELHNYNVIVNAIVWDTRRKDHIIYREDLSRMQNDTLIIDISCDRNGGIETSIPTSIENPIYKVDGITHYVVDHTPTLFYKTISKTLSTIVSDYLNFLMSDLENTILKQAKIIECGQILDQRIIDFQKSKSSNIS